MGDNGIPSKTSKLLTDTVRRTAKNLHHAGVCQFVRRFGVCFVRLHPPAVSKLCAARRYRFHGTYLARTAEITEHPKTLEKIWTGFPRTGVPTCAQHRFPENSSCLRRTSWSQIGCSAMAECEVGHQRDHRRRLWSACSMSPCTDSDRKCNQESGRCFRIELWNGVGMRNPPGLDPV
jgi:hypothetical protein